MPTIEEVLREKTFKDEFDTVEERVFHTLWDDERLRTHRLCRLTGLLAQRLSERGLLSDDELDRVLLEIV